MDGNTAAAEVSYAFTDVAAIYPITPSSTCLLYTSIECPAKMGLYRINESEVCLIDSGNDKDSGKKALKAIEGQGWKLSMIINTHFHACLLYTSRCV